VIQTAEEVTKEYVFRQAARIFQNNEPSESDIKWIESLDSDQLLNTFKWLKDNCPIDTVRTKQLSEALTGDPISLSNCWGNWRGEKIERQSGGGWGCYSDGFTNDWGCRCGCSRWDPMPDKVYFSPCTNYSNPGSILIWSSDWRSRSALGSAVSSRVYRGCVQICVGYWSLYFSGTKPYTFMDTTYILLAVNFKGERAIFSPQPMLFFYV